MSRRKKKKTLRRENNTETGIKKIGDDVWHLMLENLNVKLTGKEKTRSEFFNIFFF